MQGRRLHSAWAADPGCAELEQARGCGFGFCAEARKAHGGKVRGQRRNCRRRFFQIARGVQPHKAVQRRAAKARAGFLHHHKARLRAAVQMQIFARRRAHFRLCLRGRNGGGRGGIESAARPALRRALQLCSQRLCQRANREILLGLMPLIRTI